MQKSIGFILIICAAISCNSHPNPKLILGTWGPPDTSKYAKVRLTFLQNNIAFVKLVGNPTLPRDSMIYKFSDDEKNILTSEKNGQHEKLEIFKLTKKELIFIRKKDTLLLERK